MQLLAERNLTFDLCVSHEQLPAVAALVEACPGTSFVLDHLGKPAVAAALLDPWRDDIARLAVFPNVTCKLSGLATEASRGLDERGRAPVPRARARGVRADALHGRERLAVLTLAGTMEGWFDAVLDVVDELPEHDRRAVLWGTASTVYGIDP